VVEEPGERRGGVGRVEPVHVHVDIPRNNQTCTSGRGHTNLLFGVQKRRNNDRSEMKCTCKDILKNAWTLHICKCRI